MLAAGGGTQEPCRPHPQGVPKDVKEPAWTKGPGTAVGRVPLAQGAQPGPMCVSPPGTWPKLCFPELRRTGWLHRYPLGSIRLQLPGQRESARFLLAPRFSPT